MTTNEWTKKFQDLPGVKSKAQAFMIQARPNNDTMVILVHGFTSTPYEMQPIAEILADKGLDVEAILLAGHGRSLRDLASATLDDWQHSVNNAVIKNAAKYKNIYIVGYSFGANLAIQTAINNSKVDGVVSLGIPIFLKKRCLIYCALPFFRLFNLRYQKTWISKKKAKVLAERGSHSIIPAKSFVHFNKFIKEYTKKQMARLKVPILMMHSRNDLVCSARSSGWAFKRLKVVDKQLFILDKCQHSLIDNTRRDFVFTKTANFILDRI